MAKGKKQEVRVGLSTLMEMEDRLSKLEDKVEQLVPDLPSPKKATPKKKK